MEKTDIELAEIYVKNLPEKQLQGYNIAKSHLGMSFQVEKSVGFLNLKKKYLEDQQENLSK